MDKKIKKYIDMDAAIFDPNDLSLTTIEILFQRQIRKLTMQANFN